MTVGMKDMSNRRKVLC